MSHLLQSTGFKSADDVRAAVKKLGIKIEASVVPQPNPKPENVKKITTALAMHRKGHTHRVIASKLNVPISTVGKWIRDY